MSTAFQADGFQNDAFQIDADVRRPRRLSRHVIRAVAEGYASPYSVESFSELAGLVTRPGTAKVVGMEAQAETGFALGSGEYVARAVPGSLRPVNGRLGTPTPFAHSQYQTPGVQGRGRSNGQIPRGSGSAKTTPVGAEGALAAVAGGGVRNMDNQELTILVATLRARRKQKARRLTSILMRRNVRVVSERSPQPQRQFEDTP